MNTLVADRNTIRDWLMPKLEAIGLSVEQLANLTGLSRASIYFYLNDVTRPTEENMKKICDAVGAPFEEGLRQYTPKRAGRPRRSRSSL
jgi:transcriptional regulator with XRE-family HTH domain